MHCERIAADNHILLKITGSITGINDCIILGKEISIMLDGCYRTVVIDLTNVKGINSSFCGLLSGISRRANEENSRLVVVCPKESVIYQVLESLDMPGLMDIVGSEKELSIKTDSHPILSKERNDP